jgi:NDP-sugar pyrophosphorylase family protein
MSRAAIELVPPTGYQDIKEALIPRLHAAGMLVSTYVVGTPAMPRVADAVSYLAVSKWAVERLSAEEPAPAGYVRIGEALIHESARLGLRARFVGPVLIGPQCRIEEDALVVGPTSIGEGGVVGRQAVVCRCVLWSRCRVGAGAMVDHCILADEAVVPEHQVLRESICVARPARVGWCARICGWLGRKRPAAMKPVTSAGWLPPSANSRTTPRVVIRSDRGADGTRAVAKANEQR